MRWRARKQPGPADGSATGAAEGAVARRAVVVPLEAENKLGNENNFSPDARVPTRLVVVVRPEGTAGVGDGDRGGDGDGGAAAQTVAARVPNWLTVVLCYAGSNHGPSADLPAEVEVGVQVDPHTGVVVGVDVDAAVTDLAPYREVATRWWKETDAPLADLRGLAALPGDAVRGVRGVRGMASTWRRAVSDLRDDARASGPPTAAHGEAEAEQLRRTSATVRHRLQGNPKQLAKIRASALEAGPMMVANVRAGSMSATDLESWLTFQVGSGAVTEAEAADWRAAARAD